jgi:AraC family transcriptional regulator of adaptative response/methylated-DNA-[protein]-cysteine methyltransferase
MQSENPRDQEIFYRAYLRRDTSFEGIFYIAVKTTGVFCRPGCSARPPKRANVEFFRSPDEAMDRGYRPCKRCNPQHSVGDQPDWLQRALRMVESAHSERVGDRELAQQGIDPVRLRRWCLRHWGMTFHQYQRRWRIGVSIEQINAGQKVIDSAGNAGYESLSGFSEAFKRFVGSSPRNASDKTALSLDIMQTPLGQMYAGATSDTLCLLEFTDREDLPRQIKRIQSNMDAVFLPGSNPLTRRVQQQLNEYFAGSRMSFDLPVRFCGTAFQQSVWHALQQIPYASTRNYQQQAKSIGRPEAVRAVASANAANPLAIVVPCHRVIGKQGALSGYAGGVWRKRYLIELEAASGECQTV